MVVVLRRIDVEDNDDDTLSFSSMVKFHSELQPYSLLEKKYC